MENIELLIARHAPTIYELIGENKNYWKKVHQKFEIKIKGAKIGQITENSIPILVGKIEENRDPVALSFMNLIDSTIRELVDKLTPNLLIKLKKMVCTLVFEFDKNELKKPNPAYLNWFSEILSINTILKSGEYTLIDFETSLSNGKSMDFELKDSKGKIILVDVLNIHIPSNMTNTQVNLNLHIEGKLNDKIVKKIGNLESQDNLFILPIFWFENDITSYIISYVKSSNFKKGQIISPCMLGQNIIEDEKSYVFGTIESLIV